MLDVAVKCRALLFTRTWAQDHRKGSAPAEWLQYWKIQFLGDNPISPDDSEEAGVQYAYVQDMPYVVARKGVETPKVFRKRVCDTMYILSRAVKEQQEIRVVN
jgi:hypothetical protein